MSKTLKKEEWKEISFPKHALRKQYAISNHGNIRSFEDSIKKGTDLKTHNNKGYETVSLKPFGGYKSLFIHRTVAEAFLKQPSKKHTYVIHLDHNKENNLITNLKWVTKEEQKAHEMTSPLVIAARRKRMVFGVFSKVLTEAKVTQLKKKLWNPKRKTALKVLAEQFGISEMNLYRIKRGDFWYHIKVEGEPVHPKYAEYIKKQKGVKNTTVVAKKKK